MRNENFYERHGKRNVTNSGIASVASLACLSQWRDLRKINTELIKEKDFSREPHEKYLIPMLFVVQLSTREIPQVRQTEYCRDKWKNF